MKLLKIGSHEIMITDEEMRVIVGFANVIISRRDEIIMTLIKYRLNLCKKIISIKKYL